MIGDGMKKINNRGFTLVELLAVFAILSIIMLVAVPNVMGILDKNKKSTYVQNAKQMIALAEYKFSADATIPRPSSGEMIVFLLSALEHQDLQTGPEGGNYDLNQSFVVLYNDGSTYHYWVTLRENFKGKTRGIPLIERSSLNREDAIEFVDYINENDTLVVGGQISGLPGVISYICE